jgi:hypothetical protein
MATLNVRDRVIEAKIAYVGTDLSGQAGPFEQLRRAVPGGRAGALEEQTILGGHLLSFDWRPSGIGPFNDCDVSVKLVGTQGDVGHDEVQRVLFDADGLVLVIDADPAAHESNQRSVATVREAIARDGVKVRPVVVQVNKRAPSDAVPPGELEGAAWPQVSASTVSGEGVIEALERAATLVIDAIKSPADEAAPPPRGDTGPRVEGNPLLAALRQILQSTVAEHVAVLEERLAARIDERFVAREGAAAERIQRLEETVLGAFARIEAITECAPAACTKDDIDASTAGVLDAIALGRDTIELEMRAQRIALRDDLAAEITRAVTARARGDRDALVAAVTAVERHVEAGRADVTGADPRGVVGDVAAGVERLSQVARVLGEKMDAALKLIEPTAGALRTIRERLNGTHAEIQETLDVRIGESLTAINETLRALRTGTDRGLALADERTAEVRSGLFDLIDALKNQKRGWFR